MPFYENVDPAEILKPEIILLGSSSEAKLIPTTESANLIFGYARVVSVEAHSGVSNNPYGAVETISGALNRMQSISTGNESQIGSEYLTIENGIFPTLSNSGEEIHVLEFNGIPSIHDLPLGSMRDESFIPPDTENAKFFDRAVVVAHDRETATTFIGVSRGVEFPSNAVRKAIGELGGQVRVSEVMKDQLIEQGLISVDGTVLEGNLKGQTFDVQDPQRFLTSGEFSRANQILEVEKLVFEKVSKKRQLLNLHTQSQ